MNYKQLDLIDLISERHVQLRKLTEELWNKKSNIYISNSEWFIIARIYQNDEATISYVTKNVDISRQAVHKLIKSLEEKGIVTTYSLEKNKKEKGIKLTGEGIACFERNESLKAELEAKIVQNIGAENVLALKEILESDWGI